MIKMVLKKIKGLKGILWKKIQQKPKEEVKLPKFQVESPKAFVELPSTEDQTKIDVRYPLILPFTYAHIKWNPKEKQLEYLLEEPELSEEDKEKLKAISSALIDLIEVSLKSIKSTRQATIYLEEQIKKAMKELAVSMSSDQYIRIMYYIYRNFIGLNEIEPLLRDPWLEDIGCDGIKVPLYVIHRKYGSMKTNIVFENLKDLREFVVKLSERCGRYVSYAEPILDGTLPDGSRVNATLAGDIATRGPTFSIRKFGERPFSPVDQIELGTISPTAMAYFWYLVESGVSLLIAGGVATGKTSFLNSISMFIPPEAKIVSIEDTRELRIPHEHWIPSVTRLGFGIPLPTGEKYGEITLFDLLKGSFRQNPDYTIVGEVRGKEAYVMFQGMSSLPGWERVIVLNDNHVRRISIEDLCINKNCQAITIDPKTRKVKILPIKTKIKHPPRTLLYKIITETGRHVITTPDHSLFTFEDGIRPIRVDELKVGSKIIIPSKLPCGYNDVDNLSLVKLLPDLRIFAPKYVKKAVKVLGYEKASKICSVKSISDYYSKFKDHKPSALISPKFFKLMKKAGIDVNLDNLQVRFSRKSKKLPAKIKVTSEFLRLIGYYISEGTLNESSDRIAIYNQNEKILDDMRHCIKSVSGAKPRERKTGGYSWAIELAFNHKVLFEFLKRFCGKSSKNKRIPNFIFGLNKKRIGQFLSALYAGDGWFFKRSGNYVFGYSTKSEELADDLSHLLLTFGIVARIKDRRQESKDRGYEIIFYRRHEQEEFVKHVKLIDKEIEFEKLAKENWRIKDDVYIDDVKTIEKIKLEKPQAVFDLSILGIQSFIGGFGGVMIHNSGHPCMSTFHAGSVDTVIKRLTTPPIELSSSLVESLNAIVIMVHAKEKGKSARRIKEVDEIISVEHGTLKAETFRSVEWDPGEDTFKFDKNSYLLKKIAHNKGVKIEDVLKEITRRKAVLEWMVKNGIKDYVEVCKIINEYYKNPEKILKQVETIAEIKPLKKEEITKEKKLKEEKEPKKIAVAEIFGYKVVSEK